jgi:energy-coupling factor transport system permease protein
MKLPVEAAVSLGIAFASVPLMINQFRTVIEAQKSRGAKFEIRNPITKMRAYVPIIVPSIYLTVLRGIDISRTIESKAFTYNPAKRTFKKILNLKRADFGAALVALVFTGLLVYLKFFYLWFDYPFTLNILRSDVIPWLFQAIDWLRRLIFGG